MYSNRDLSHKTAVGFFPITDVWC